MDYLVTVRGLSLPDVVMQIIRASPNSSRQNNTPITEHKPSHSNCRPDTPITGVFFHIWPAVVLIQKSSPIALSLVSFMRMLNVITVYSGLLFCKNCGDYMRPKLSSRVNANDDTICT